MVYKTKTEKKRALVSMDAKARKLYLCGVLSIKDAETINKISDKGLNKMKKL